MAAIVSKFEEYCIPRENTVSERFLFVMRDQRNLKLLINISRSFAKWQQILVSSQLHSSSGIEWRQVPKLPKFAHIDIAPAAESTATQIKGVC